MAEHFDVTSMTVAGRPVRAVVMSTGMIARNLSRVADARRLVVLLYLVVRRAVRV
jgi:hypothetical protein